MIVTRNQKAGSPVVGEFVKVPPFAPAASVCPMGLSPLSVLYSTAPVMLNFFAGTALPIPTLPVPPVKVKTRFPAPVSCASA